MNAEKIMRERRKDPRYKARTGAFAVMIPNSAIQGQIQDISKGGFSFNYSGKDWSQEDIQSLSIFFISNRFFLNMIPCKVISNSEIETDIPFSSTKVRRCGVQFGNLSPYQVNQLDYFLRNLTCRSSYYKFNLTTQEEDINPGSGFGERNSSLN